MSKTIKLNRNQLINLISESVNRIINESDYMDDGDLERQYRKNPDSMWTYGTNLNPEYVSGLDPHSMRNSGNGNKRADNLASWDYFDAVRNGADMRMRNRLDADAYEQNNPYKRELQAYMHGWNQEKGRYDTPMSMFKDELDKRWQDTKDLEKASRMADSRRLHRKGSLNRDIKESVEDDWAYEDWTEHDYHRNPTIDPNVKKANRLCDEIEEGVYDNDLDGILSIGASEYFNIPTEYGLDNWVNYAASERKAVIGKK